MPGRYRFSRAPLVTSTRFSKQAVAVRRTNIDTPRLETVSVFGQLRLKRLVSAQPTQSRLAGVVRRHMLNDEEGGRQVSRQLTDELIERFKASRRGADNNDVSSLTCFTGLLPFSRSLQRGRPERRTRALHHDEFTHHRIVEGVTEQELLPRATKHESSGEPAGPPPTITTLYGRGVSSSQ